MSHIHDTIDVMDAPPLVRICFSYAFTVKAVRFYYQDDYIELIYYPLRRSWNKSHLIIGGFVD